MFSNPSYLLLVHKPPEAFPVRTLPQPLLSLEQTSYPLGPEHTPTNTLNVTEVHFYCIFTIKKNKFPWFSRVELTF